MVKEAVTAENEASDIGMHGGRRDGLSSVELMSEEQVTTDLI